MKRAGGVVLLEMARPDEVFSSGVGFGGCGLFLPIFWFFGLGLGTWWLAKYLWNRILWSRFRLLLSKSPIARYAPQQPRPWEELPVISSPGFHIDHVRVLATGVPPHDSTEKPEARQKRFTELLFRRLLASGRTDIALVSLNGTPALCRSYHFDSGVTYAFYYLQVTFSGARTEWSVCGTFRDLFRWEKAGEERSLRYFEKDMVVPFFNEVAQLAFLETVGLGLETGAETQTTSARREESPNASDSHAEAKPSSPIPNAQESRTRPEGEGFRKRW